MPSTLVYTLPSAECRKVSDYRSYVFLDCVICGELVGRVVGGDVLKPEGLTIESLDSQEEIDAVTAAARNVIPSLAI
jgi:hypothetical protein